MRELLFRIFYDQYLILDIPRCRFLVRSEAGEDCQSRQPIYQVEPLDSNVAEDMMNKLDSDSGSSDDIDVDFDELDGPEETMSNTMIQGQSQMQR